MSYNIGPRYNGTGLYRGRALLVLVSLKTVDKMELVIIETFNLDLRNVFEFHLFSGMTESVVAAALSRIGWKVLHLDR